MSGKAVYLGGSMQDLRDYGVGWRRREKRWLEEHGEEVFSPPDREHHILVKYDVKPSMLRSASRALDKQTKREVFRDIRDFDLNQVAYRTKYLVVYYTRPSDGTITEVGVAGWRKIPVYMVCRTRPKSWTDASVTRYFTSFKQLHQFLKIHYGLKLRKRVKP